MFSKDGRNQIKKDYKRTELLGGALVDIVKEESVRLQDAMQHIDDVQKDFDVQKAFALANNGKNIESLQGNGSTAEEKDAAIKQYAKIYADVYGVSIESANIIATSKVISGTTYTKNNKSTIDINDNAQRNATDYAKAMMHEVTHVRIRQGTTRDREDKDLNEQYADSMGEYSADGMVFSSYNYNNVQLNRNEKSNLFKRNQKGNTILASNNKRWRTNIARAKNKDGVMDFRQLYKRETRILDLAKEKINNNAKLSTEQKKLMHLQLNAVACAEINCAEGVPEDDVHYQQLSKLQTLGNELKDKDLTLKVMLGQDLPEGSFKYGLEDNVQDFLTRNDKVVQKGKGAINTVIGGVGVVVGATATVVTSPACTTVVGCVIPVATGAGTILATAQMVDGVTDLFGDYTSKEGQRVLDSFIEEKHQGDRSLITDAALSTGLWVAETIVIKKVAKLIPDGVLGKKGELDEVASNNRPSQAELQGPYDPNKTRAGLEATNGVENIKSSTNPNIPLQRVNSNLDDGIEVIHSVNGSKAVRVKFDDPVTGKPSSANIAYNNRGLPVFDDHAKYTTMIDKTKNYDAQFTQATRDLRDGISSGSVDASQFTVLQLKQINSGKAKIKDFTWHHNADSGNMQLVPTTVHDAVKHIGQKALDKGK